MQRDRDENRRRSRLQVGSCLLLVVSLGAVPVAANAQEPRPNPPVRILLLGDSTVIGSVCRKVAPKADHLEDVIRKRLAAEKGVPTVEVVNQGRDGEYIQRLLQARYEPEIKPLGKFDLVLIRFGINDRARRENFFENFPRDFHDLIARLKADSPGVQVILETTIPFGSAKREEEINGLVRKVAKEENLPILDTYATFAAALKSDGPNVLTYHRVKLTEIPEGLRSLLPPESLKIIKDEVVVMDNLLDAHFRNLPRWSGDRHPNMAGYHVIGRGVAEYLAPVLSKVKK